ncbi:hypothetical protein N8H22_02800 [Stutzerimonas stutzeri]|uniref:hypothetical protein n=1 Tax=Stutzerimonas sp. S1 TaxID=3030652 RepID=UPI0022246A03|nr:hypothetical protein [Stutzerimonas sp. S1]MCW3147533.1 hypothetical protein [Stutzerimonas sp. S1]
MKRIIFVIWGVLSLLLGAAALLELLQAPSLARGLALLLVVYCSFCVLQFLRTAYQPWGLLGPRRRCGYWLCLLLLPLTLLPLHSAFEIWQQGAYIANPAAPGWRFSVAFGRQLLVWLQELIGYVGPLLVLLAIGVGTAVLLLRLLRTQVVR